LSIAFIAASDGAAFQDRANPAALHVRHALEPLPLAQDAAQPQHQEQRDHAEQDEIDRQLAGCHRELQNR
jgi:hypothetical protein